MAAAIVGNKNVEPRLSRAAQRLREDAQQAEKLKRWQQSAQERVMELCDANADGALDKDELSKMLVRFAMEYAQQDYTPSSQELDFIFAHCGRKIPGTSGKRKLDKTTTLHILNAWNEFLGQREDIRDYFARFHKGAVGSGLTQSELQDLLNSENRHPLPEQVVSWIHSQADLTGTGELSPIEVARAFCAYDLWKNGKDKYMYARPRLSVGVRLDSSLPKPAKSAMCTVQ